MRISKLYPPSSSFSKLALDLRNSLPRTWSRADMQRYVSCAFGCCCLLAISRYSDSCIDRVTLPAAKVACSASNLPTGILHPLDRGSKCARNKCLDFSRVLLHFSTFLMEYPASVRRNGGGVMVFQSSSRRQTRNDTTMAPKQRIESSAYDAVSSSGSARVPGATEIRSSAHSTQSRISEPNLTQDPQCHPASACCIPS